MNTCFDKSDLRIDAKEFKTPSDKRTREYKKLLAGVKTIAEPYYKSQYGIFAHLTIAHKFLFEYDNRNNIN